MNKERYIICWESTHLHSSKLGPILFISIIYDFVALLQTHYLYVPNSWPKGLKNTANLWFHSLVQKGLMELQRVNTLFSLNLDDFLDKYMQPTFQVCF